MLTVSEVTADVTELPMDCPVFTMKQRKILKGHQRKVLHFDWCPDSRHLLSGAQVNLTNHFKPS